MGQWGKIKYEDGYSFIPHLNTSSFSPISGVDFIDDLLLLNRHASNDHEFDHYKKKYIGMQYREYLETFRGQNF